MKSRKPILFLLTLIFFAFFSYSVSAPILFSRPSVDLGENTKDYPVKVAPLVAKASEESSYVAKPARLLIPKIGVDARVLHIGLTKEGAVGVPEGAKDTSWFDIGTRPGQKGSAVISGHYGRWKNGTNSVFNLLPSIIIGDKIYIEDANGITLSFTVKKIAVYDKDAIVPEIFNKTDGKYMNIITCHGTYLENQQTYSQRLVVFTEAD